MGGVVLWPLRQPDEHMLVCVLEPVLYVGSEILKPFGTYNA